MDGDKVDLIMGNAGYLEIEIQKNPEKEIHEFSEAFAAIKVFLADKGLLEEFSSFYGDYKSSWNKTMWNMVRERLNGDCCKDETEIK